MFKTILIEGGDGVGKTTLALETAKQITKRHGSIGYEGFCTRFPSDAVAGFRNFFLAQQACRPALTDSKVIWSEGYTGVIPPLTNLLHVLADFNYAYTALLNAPDIQAVRMRGAVPVLVIDREILSTIVYQIMYPFDNKLLLHDTVIETKTQLFLALRRMVEHSIIPTIRHDLLVHMTPKAIPSREQTCNTFDMYDQTLLQRCYGDLYRMIIGEDKVSSLAFLDHQIDGESGVDWLRRRFGYTYEISAFSQPSEELAIDVADSAIKILENYKEEYANNTAQ